MSGSPVELIVAHECRIANGDIEGAVSRAAYAGGRLITGSTVESIANYLGISIPQVKKPDSKGTVMGFDSKVSNEDRVRFGYDDLPQDLLRTVQRDVSQLIPEYMDVLIPYTLAGRVMGIVRQQPFISPMDLRLQLAETPINGSGQPAELVVLDGVATLAHYHSAIAFRRPRPEHWPEPEK